MNMLWRSISKFQGHILRQDVLKIGDLSMVYNLDFVSKLIKILCVSQIKFYFQTHSFDLLWTLILGMLQRNKPQNENTIV
jgi:hypothetical protein